MSGVTVPAGMREWHGGDSAPADWDGGPVLLRCGRVWDRSKDGSGQALTWDRRYSDCPGIQAGDVIAYTPSRKEHITSNTEETSASSVGKPVADNSELEPDDEASRNRIPDRQGRECGEVGRRPEILAGGVQRGECDASDGKREAVEQDAAEGSPSAADPLRNELWKTEAEWDAAMRDCYFDLITGKPIEPWAEKAMRLGNVSGVGDGVANSIKRALKDPETRRLLRGAIREDRHPGWMDAGHAWLDAGAPTDVRSLRYALDKLQASEAAYRYAHDHYGGDDIRTGRAWDLLRREGDRARKLLDISPHL